jgi:hypothetical protein
VAVSTWQRLNAEERDARTASYKDDPVLWLADHFYLPNGLTYGECWQPFQEALFRAVFTYDPLGCPTAGQLLLDIRRRGESKTGDTAAAALLDCLVGPAGSINYACANDQEQAALILDHARGFQRRSPILKDLVISKTGITNPTNYNELRVIAADAPSSYGVTYHKCFYDELSLAPNDELWTAMWSAVAKTPQSQMVAVSMAGLGEMGIVWKVREWTSDPENHYYYHSREGSQLAPWLDPAAIERQRKTLHPADFARFFEARFADPKGAFIDTELWNAAEVGTEATSGKARAYVFVDFGLTHDATAIAVCHGEKGDDGEVRVTLDTLITRRGSPSDPVQIAAIDELIVDLTKRFPVRAVTIEAWQGIGSQQSLQARLPGIKVTASWPGAASQAAQWGNLLTLIRNHRLVVFPHEELRNEALHLVTKVVAGRITAVDSGGVHQDHILATAGAAQMVVEGMQKREPDYNWGDGMSAANARLARSGPTRASWALTSDRGGGADWVERTATEAELAERNRRGYA